MSSVEKGVGEKWVSGTIPLDECGYSKAIIFGEEAWLPRRSPGMKTRDSIFYPTDVFRGHLRRALNSRSYPRRSSKAE
ncbi:MAG: hypothetical protein Q8P26_02265 [Candidatus Levybacteria bacterium]|nr:hypothetical protein [Candidatus Levybacteria bacterium]